MRIFGLILVLNLFVLGKTEARVSCEKVLLPAMTESLSESNDSRIELLRASVLAKSPITPEAGGHRILDLEFEVLTPPDTLSPKDLGRKLKANGFLNRLAYTLQNWQLDHSWLDLIELQNPYHLERLQTLFAFEDYQIFNKTSFTHKLLNSDRGSEFFKIYFEHDFIYNRIFYSYLPFHKTKDVVQLITRSSTEEDDIVALSGKAFLDYLFDAKEIENVFYRIHQIESLSEQIHFGIRNEAFDERYLPGLNPQRLQSEAIRLEALIDHLYFYVFRSLEKDEMDQFFDQNMKHLFEIYYYHRHRDSLFLGLNKDYRKKAQYFLYLYLNQSRHADIVDELRSLSVIPQIEPNDISR